MLSLLDSFVKSLGSIANEDWHLRLCEYPSGIHLCIDKVHGAAGLQFPLVDGLLGSVPTFEQRE